MPWPGSTNIAQTDCERTPLDAIQDDSEPPFSDRVDRASACGRASRWEETFISIAEDERNERKLVLPAEQGGHGFDAVWSDDFHHHLRHRLAGDSDGYYRDFDGTTESIAKTIRDGWFFNGQYARFHRSVAAGQALTD